MRTALDVCLTSCPTRLRGRRVGLLSNQASVDHRFRPAHEALAEVLPGGIRALFSPQHGLWSIEQDNMVETPHGHDPMLGVPIHSLYEAARRPTAAMLDGLDLLLVDLQDVGTRVYTYVWTLSLCLEACAERGLPVSVLDRPNPLGGVAVEGPRLERECRSFVGRASIPMRHGLTMGELARHVDRVLGIGAEIEVVSVEGLRRDHLWSDLGRAWVPTSPNLPRIEAVQVYPGTVLLEGTNLSEGRGTTTPFETVGAPFVDPYAWRAELADLDLPGVVLRVVEFRPTFQKWAGERCRGLCLHVVDVASFRPYRTAAALIGAAQRLWPGDFSWRLPPYEYETEKMPIDILSGSAALRLAVDRGLTREDLDAVTALDECDWWDDVADDLLYPPGDPLRTCRSTS